MKYYPEIIPEVHENFNPLDNMDEAQLYDYAYKYCKCNQCRACKDREADNREDE